MGGGGVPAVMEALDVRPVWFGGGVEQAGQGGSVTNAMMAVAAGVCRHVLCFRTVWETTAALRARRKSTAGIRSGPRVSGEMEWRLPYGAMSAAMWIGMREPLHAQVRHDARAARLDPDDHARARGPESGRDLSGRDDPRRLSRGADDHDALRPLRLRRALRRASPSSSPRRRPRRIVPTRRFASKPSARTSPNASPGTRGRSCTSRWSKGRRAISGPGRT